MKKLLVALLIMLMNVPVFSQTGSPPPKTFQIHSEKRPFIKKGERKKRKHHRHIKHKMMEKKHFRENHKK